MLISEIKSRLLTGIILWSIVSAILYIALYILDISYDSGHLLWWFVQLFSFPLIIFTEIFGIGGPEVYFTLLAIIFLIAAAIKFSWMTRK